MPRYRIALDTAKCQSYGNCLSLAPAVFAWDRARKVRLVDSAGAAPETVLKAAKLCPYRAIAILDDDSGAPVFPPPRQPRPS